MNVINYHTRDINASITQVGQLFNTLATTGDLIWPHKLWPPIRFKDGFTVGNRGGHGPIRYFIEAYVEQKYVRFRFLKPAGFDGIHQLELVELGNGRCSIRHLIDMKTNLMGTIQWVLAIRWLHDALIEDAFDQVENQFSSQQTSSNWSLWVKLLRFLLK